MNHASTMNDDKQALLDQVDKDRDMLIEFLCRFIRAKSPNPPGDTREAAAHVTAFLSALEDTLAGMGAGIETGKAVAAAEAAPAAG